MVILHKILCQPQKPDDEVIWIFKRLCSDYRQQDSVYDTWEEMSTYLNRTNIRIHRHAFIYMEIFVVIILAVLRFRLNTVL